jgi:hypothetical protein
LGIWGRIKYLLDVRLSIPYYSWIIKALLLEVRNHGSIPLGNAFGSLYAFDC